MTFLKRTLLCLGLAMAAGGQARAIEPFGAPGAPPWNHLAAPAKDHQQCLCGWVYNDAVTAWSTVENQPAAQSCKAICTAAPKPAPADLPAQTDKWKGCMSYARTGAGWQAGQALQPDGTSCQFYFPTNKTVANWEAGYAPSGAVVKKINFFWWGNPATDDYKHQAFDDADKWAALLKGQGYAIDYWAQPAAVAPDVAAHFPAHGGPAITLKTIGPGGTVKSAGALLEGTDLAHEAADLDKIVGSLTANRVFVAVKDLVVLAALYKQGGYFFDATVAPNLTDGAAAAKKLTDGARALKCPVYVTDPKSGYGSNGWSVGGPVQSILYEVNIMYHPARNAATGRILQCVMDDWKKLGADTGVAVVGEHAALFTPEQTAKRNTEIGQIITSCTTIYMATCLHENLVEGRLSAWLGKQPAQAKQGVSELVADQIGVTKVYKGTGR